VPYTLHSPDEGKERKNLINKNKVVATVAHILLDATGSMGGHEDITLSTLNEYLSGIKGGNETAKFTVSLNTFNSETGMLPLFSSKLAKDIPEVTRPQYQCLASTPLYDATAKTIYNADKEAKAGQPVLIVIQTDGLENASTEYGIDAVKALVEKKTQEGWQFVYLGQTLDAAAQAAFIGVAAGSSYSYGTSRKSVEANFSALKVDTSRYARGGSAASADFTGSTGGRDFRDLDKDPSPG